MKLGVADLITSVKLKAVLMDCAAKCGVRARHQPETKA